MSRQSASLSFAVVVAVCCAVPYAAAGEPTPPAKQDDTTQLKTYSVGGTKTTPKADIKATQIEKPTFDSNVGFEKPTMEAMDMTPFTVMPVTVAPSKPAAAAPKAAAPVASAPARPVSNAATPAGGGATPTLPPAAAPVRSTPSPAGAVPQVKGGTVPTLALVPLSTPAPDYPRDAMVAGTQGYVLVEFTINLEGATQDVTVVDASPQRVFDQAARRAVMRWKFQPLLEGGMPVEKRVQRRIDFKL